MSAFPELLPGMRSQCRIYFVITSAVSETWGRFSAAFPSSAAGAALVSWDRHPQEGRTEVQQSQHPAWDRPSQGTHSASPPALPPSHLQVLMANPLIISPITEAWKAHLPQQGILEGLNVSRRTRRSTPLFEEGVCSSKDYVLL